MKINGNEVEKKMTANKKFYPDGTKKKEVIPIKKDGKDFKLITNYSGSNVISVMEKPNLNKIDPSILVSGAHVFSNSEFNHIDFFLGGLLIKKEYPLDGETCYYGYGLSRSDVIMPKRGPT